ncbi:MAG: thioredoxin-like domain-containing protein [Ignavibacteriaceae bacterium]
MKYISIAIILLIVSAAHAQTIKLIVHEIQTSKAYIYSLQGERTDLLDSVESNKKDEFVYHFNIAKYHTGFYRITFGTTRWIDFIDDGKNIEIKTDANNILDSLHVDTSESNRLYYSFIKINKLYKTKTELLQLILARYPKDDEYYKTTKSTLSQVQQEYLNFIDNTSQADPGSFIARYIKSSQLPVFDESLPPDKQLDFLKAHSLDNVDFQDGELTYSDLFTSKTIEYLTYYRNPQLPKELLEKEFIIAIDTILNKAKVNYRVYKQIVEYLIDGFKKFGFENDLNYVVDNYVIKDNLCLDDETEKSIQLMLDQDKILRINSTAPNIMMKDTSGNQIDLGKIKADNILILFYASWCPHCQVMIPKLAEYLKSHKRNNLKVLAISLDTDRNAWINFIRNNKLSWINISDLKGWSGKSASDYFIYATPTMFLLDRDKKIIGKPTTIAGLNKLF